MGEKKTVMLTITEQCNLDCIYCYEKNKSLKTMDFNILRGILDMELCMEDGFEEVEIQFFGGEPFIEFELIKKACNYLWSREWKKTYYCFATTNGTLVHNEIKVWLEENRDKFTCSLSIDGNKDAHNVNRCSSFDLIDIDFFKEMWPDQTAKMTISPESLPFLADSIIYLHKRGILFNNNLAYGVNWTDSKLLETIIMQFERVSDFYLENPEIIPCKMLNMSIENILSEHKIERWCGAGVSLKSYDADGILYPCHLFQPISTDKKKADKAFSINFSSKNTVDPKCDKCRIYNICPTCYGHNYEATGNIAVRDEALCKFTKLSILVTSYLWLKKFEKYNVNELGLSLTKYRQLFEASKVIQNTAEEWAIFS